MDINTGGEYRGRRLEGMERRSHYTPTQFLRLHTIIAQILILEECGDEIFILSLRNL